MWHPATRSALRLCPHGVSETSSGFAPVGLRSALPARFRRRGSSARRDKEDVRLVDWRRQTRTGQRGMPAQEVLAGHRAGAGWLDLDQEQTTARCAEDWAIGG